MNILHLPVEVHLDIFKHLNFDQISSIEQTNGYFRSLINKYIGVLAKKKFYSFETIVYKSVNDKNKYLKLNEEDILHMRLDDIFAWSDDIGEKWKVVVDNKTPMYLFSESLKSKEQYIINFAICLTKEKPKGKGDKSKRLLLKLPYIPKNMKEMFLWRIWLERLFLHCIFEEKIICENVIFNPIMILVMFNNAIPLISLKMNYCESGTCADGGQFSFRMFPNFMEDMEKENASKNFPWLHYAKFAQLSCWIFLQDDGTGLGKELNFCFISTFGYRNRVPME